MSHHRDSPTATAGGRIDQRPAEFRFPDRVCRLGQSGLLSGEVTGQVERLSHCRQARLLLCRPPPRGDVAAGR
jgi:hypothetical protein